jgi:hypothetical protein
VLTDFTRSDLYALLATGSPLGLTNGCQAKDYREGNAAP